MRNLSEILTEEQKVALKDVYVMVGYKMQALLPEAAAPTKEILVVIAIDDCDNEVMGALKAEDFKEDCDGDFLWTEEGDYISPDNMPEEVYAILKEANAEE